MKLLYKVTILIAFLFCGCKLAQDLTPAPTDSINIQNTMTSDVKVERLIRPYKEAMSEAMNEVIGFCPAFIEKKKPSSAIGSMMADAVMTAAVKIDKRTDFCLLNYGGIRSTLDSGEITVGEVYQIMPFENQIIILKMEATYLDTLATFTANKGGEPFSKEVMQLDRTKISQDGYFYLATNDYMANGGDNYSFLTKASERITTNIKIRDAIMEYVKEQATFPLDYSIRKL